MAIIRIERAVYGVEDVAECTRFFEDFGLDPVPKSGTAVGASVELATRTGQIVELRPLDDPDLPAGVEPGSTIREIVWGVESQADLDRLHAELSRDREVTVDGDGVLHTVDETGYGIGFAVVAPQDSQPEDSQPTDRPVNQHGDVRRWNAPIDPFGRVRPLRLCHVALNIPKEGRERATGFYLDRLGFRATDVVKPMGTFMRAEGDSDQHTMLLCHRPDRAGLNHTAYEVRDFDEVVLGANHMIEQGWREARKLGRHTVGSNVFRFVHAPCGGRVEYAADMDRADDSFETRVHETTPPHHIWTLQTNRDNDREGDPA
ncbi:MULTISPECIES: VOC family protein [Streptacidiphilus]|uniref:VOC family protein n=1 Tax=Streptacidiphilus cavernicola TaxID=3342716 RepID=A0ABV6UIX7_9ACTN|nr:VOC family protein [Streptacidiphilus jeojiense]